METILLTCDPRLTAMLTSVIRLAGRTFTSFELLLKHRKLLQAGKLLIVLDERLAKGQSLLTLSQLLELSSETAWIVLCSHALHLSVSASKRIAFLPLRFTPRQFSLALKSLSLQEVPVTKHPVDALSHQFIGVSKAAQRIRNDIRTIGRSPCSVLIQGETGTGKEIVARLMHEVSGVAGQLVVENCSGLSGSLVASELFGVKKGAYTDAKEDRAGLVEHAHNGTLFLDEISELPIDTQAKFLRLLETGEYRSVGDIAIKTCSFRLISASNEPVSNLITHTKMRKDFYYRISDFIVNIPPLRSRKEDIPLLIDYFLKQEAVTKPLTKESMEILVQAHWPGNVRQLFSVLRKGIFTSKDKDELTIGKEDVI